MYNAKEISKKVGEKIKYYRNLKNLSLSYLAKKANISKSTLFGLEEGDANPTINTLCALANTLEIPLLELIEGKETFKKDRNFKIIDEDLKRDFKSIKISLNNYSLHYEEAVGKEYEVDILILKGSLKIGDIATLKENETISFRAIKPLLFIPLSKNVTFIYNISKVEDEIFLDEDIFLNENELNIKNITKLIELSLIENLPKRILSKGSFPYIDSFNVILSESKKSINYLLILPFFNNLIENINYIINSYQDDAFIKISKNLDIKKNPNLPPFIENLTQEIKKILLKEPSNYSHLLYPSILFLLYFIVPSNKSFLDSSLNKISNIRNLPIKFANNSYSDILSYIEIINLDLKDLETKIENLRNGGRLILISPLFSNKSSYLKKKIILYKHLLKLLIETIVIKNHHIKKEILFKLIDIYYRLNFEKNFSSFKLIDEILEELKNYEEILFINKILKEIEKLKAQKDIFLFTKDSLKNFLIKNNLILKEQFLIYSTSNESKISLFIFYKK